MSVRNFWPAAALAFGLFGCSKAPPSGAPAATVTLRDGSTVAGTVLSSSASQIEIMGGDRITRTIPMSQVRSVDYGDAAAAPAASAASDAAAPAAAPAAPPPAAVDRDDQSQPPAGAITTRTYVVPAGAQVSVRTEESIDSAHAVEGQTYAAEVTKTVRDAAGDAVVPRGANARLIIRSASKGGHIRGASDLVLDLASVSVGGQLYRLNTADVEARGHSGIGANKRTAEFAGGGAAIGSIIGAIAGHGKGAAIGAGAGAGGGALAQILTKGSIRIPAESVLTFRLETPLHVVAAQ